MIWINAILPAWNQLVTDTLSLYNSIKQFTLTFPFITGTFIFLIIIAIIFFILLYKIIKRKLRERKKAKEELKKMQRNVEFLLRKDLQYSDLNELKKLKSKLKEYLYTDSLKSYSERIKEKILDLTRKLKEGIHEEKLEEIEIKKEQKLEEIRKLDEIKKQKEQELKSKRLEELNKLNINENIIFEKDKLKEKQIKLLKQEKYEEAIEYDPLTLSTKKFLVKKIMNHSATHTFLVARIKQMLGDYADEDTLYSHDTVSPDITFEINNKDYAIEVEVGSLLRKKQQLKDKLKYLDKNYSNKWFFVVSNRNLVKDYKKYGKCITRKGVSDLIKDLAEN